METTAVAKRTNGIDMEILQGTVDAIEQDPGLGEAVFRARNKWIAGNSNVTTITSFYGARQENEHKQSFDLYADEPAVLAGDDTAPNPVEILLTSLASCLTTAMVAHAAVRGIEIHELESSVEGDLDLNGYLGLSNDVPRGYTDIRVKFKVKADDENTERLKRLALFSPVYNTIVNGANVDVSVEAA